MGRFFICLLLFLLMMTIGEEGKRIAGAIEASCKLRTTALSSPSNARCVMTTEQRYLDQIDNLVRESVDLRAEVERLRAALLPFAYYYDLNCHERDPDNALEVPVRDLLAAKVALSPTVDGAAS